jgi:hypothetical protein
MIRRLIPVTFEHEVMEAILKGLSLYFSNKSSRFSILNKPSEEGILQHQQ